ncbi:F-box/LRR-repeat protein 2-like [Mytilus trossulus]|uniref:F-box/LRR-repeat protein 2-like n=1 Tax=Mytilus trossulus TaxID=6551 RepID=UPI003006FDDC
MPLKTSLTSFILTDCKIDDLFVEILTESCPNLKKISFDQCQTIKDQCLQHIGDNCPLLEDLNLNQRKPEINITLPPETSISDEGLEKIAKGCPRLKRLLVNYCNNVGDSGIMSIAEHCPMLLVLETEGCSKVTEDSMECIASKCQWLRKVNIRHCKYITFHSINFLIRKCSYLEKLDLTLCGNNQFEQTENDSLSSIAKYGEKLKVLTITGNKQITIEGIKEVICSCDSLTQIDFTVGSIVRVLESQVTSFINNHDQKRIFMRTGRGMGHECQIYDMNEDYYNVQLYINGLHSRFTI